MKKSPRNTFLSHHVQTLSGRYRREQTGYSMNTVHKVSQTCACLLRHKSHWLLRHLPPRTTEKAYQLSVCSEGFRESFLHKNQRKKNLEGFTPRLTQSSLQMAGKGKSLFTNPTMLRGPGLQFGWLFRKAASSKPATV